jgi:hypothetical protein
MKKYFYYPALLALLLFYVFSISCNSILTVEKRKYRNGYYVSLNSKSAAKQTAAANAQLASKEIVLEEAHIANVKNSDIIEASIPITMETNMPENTVVLKKHESPQYLFSKSSKKILAKENALKIESTKVSLSNKNAIKWTAALASIFASFSALFFLRKNRAKGISTWAAKNINMSRTALIFLQALVLGCSFFIGKIFANNDLHISPFFGKLFVGLGLVSAAVYPVKNSVLKFFKHSYFKQKMLDATIVAAMAIATMSYANVHKIAFASNDMSQVEILTNNSTNSLIATINTDLAEQILLMILLVAATVFAIGLVAAIACNVACSGALVAAGVIFFGGVFGLLLAFLSLGRTVIHYMNKTVEEKALLKTKNKKFNGRLYLIVILSMALGLLSIYFAPLLYFVFLPLAVIIALIPFIPLIYALFHMEK